jgi:hypothetical protein
MLGGNGLVGLRCNAPSSLTLHSHGKQSVEVGAFHTGRYAKFEPLYSAVSDHADQEFIKACKRKRGKEVLSHPTLRDSKPQVLLPRLIGFLAQRLV